MPSVTEVARDNGLWLPVKELEPKFSYFERTLFEDGAKLNSEEKIDPSVIGTAVDALTRFLISRDFDDAFKVSRLGTIWGLTFAQDFISGSERQRIKIMREVTELVDKTMAKIKSAIKGLDEKSILLACYLCSFDRYYRRGGAYNPKNHELPRDRASVQNIRTYVKRSLDFFADRGEIMCGVDFPEEAFGSKVTNGDGDYLTSDTLWEMKTVRENTLKKSAPNYIRQLLIYWRMCCHSEDDFFEDIKRIGIFNPRSNTAYTLALSEIPEGLIRHIDEVIIGY